MQGRSCGQRTPGCTYALLYIQYFGAQRVGNAGSHAALPTFIILFGRFIYIFMYAESVGREFGLRGRLRLQWAVRYATSPQISLIPSAFDIVLIKI
jgi:hypothetical protein